MKKKKISLTTRTVKVIILKFPLYLGEANTFSDKRI